LSSFLPLPRPPTSTLFPYTTLFRSRLGFRLAQLLLHLGFLPPQLLQQLLQLTHFLTGGFQLLLGLRLVGVGEGRRAQAGQEEKGDRKSTRLNSSHVKISYAVFCLKK